MQHILAGSAERRRNLHGDRFAAALAGVVEYRQREDLPVKVHRHVALHLQRKVVQNLLSRNTIYAVILWHIVHYL